MSTEKMIDGTKKRIDDNNAVALGPVHSINPVSKQEDDLAEMIVQRVNGEDCAKKKGFSGVEYRTARGRFRVVHFSCDSWNCPRCAKKLSTSKYRQFKVIVNSTIANIHTIEKIAVTAEKYANLTRQINRLAREDRSVRKFPIAQEDGSIIVFVLYSGKEAIFGGQKLSRSQWNTEARMAIANIDFARTKLRPSESLYEDGILHRYEEETLWKRIDLGNDLEKILTTLKEMGIGYAHGVTIINGQGVPFIEFYVPETQRIDFLRSLRLREPAATNVTRLPRNWISSPPPEMLKMIEIAAA